MIDPVSLFYLSRIKEKNPAYYHPHKLSSKLYYLTKKRLVSPASLQFALFALTAGQCILDEIRCAFFFFHFTSASALGLVCLEFIYWLNICLFVCLFIKVTFF